MNILSAISLASAGFCSLAFVYVAVLGILDFRRHGNYRKPWLFAFLAFAVLMSAVWAIANYLKYSV